MRKYESVAIAAPTVLLPREGADLTKWSVVACDQYTSQPEYWARAAEFVGDAPSTLKMIYPEVYLSEPEAAREERIASIRRTMDEYLADGTLAPCDGMIYVERQAAGRERKGLVLAIDLEHYDYRKGSESLIRATEGTILERIPPRVRIRQGASLELPHIMVLIDDPGNTVLGPLTENKARLEKAYDAKLMADSGHLAGFRVADRALERGVAAALEGLAERQVFRSKYGLSEDAPVLLFAMGDGNHSLATAKAIWEKEKEAGGAQVMDSPLRHALVELVNLHDEALVFEPIHRVVFGVRDGRDLLREMGAHYGERFSFSPVDSMERMKARVDAQAGAPHKIGYLAGGRFGIISVESPDTNLPVGSLQIFLDRFLEGGADEVDYVHGTEAVIDLSAAAGNAGFYLPAMDKNDLFKTVILDGALPRKTFSMGEAEEKRFYMECRRIG